jgi:hypothetical protein
MTDFGKWLMGIGVIVFLAGMCWQFIGRLPGDIFVKKGNSVFYFPIVTCVIISVAVSLILSLINRWR